MALVTAGTGATLSLSTKAVGTIIGVQAGISAGGETVVQMRNQSDNVVEWKKDRNKLRLIKDPTKLEGS